MRPAPLASAQSTWPAGSCRASGVRPSGFPRRSPRGHEPNCPSLCKHNVRVALGCPGSPDGWQGARCQVPGPPPPGQNGGAVGGAACSQAPPVPCLQGPIRRQG